MEGTLEKGTELTVFSNIRNCWCLECNCRQLAGMESLPFKSAFFHLWAGATQVILHYVFGRLCGENGSHRCVQIWDKFSILTRCQKMFLPTLCELLPLLILPELELCELGPQLPVRLRLPFNPLRIPFYFDP